MTACWVKGKPEQDCKPFQRLIHLKNFHTFLSNGGRLLMAALILLTISCKKDPVELGLGIQPEEDRLGVFFNDTTPVQAFSVANDSVRTDRTVLSLAGSYYDPIFGTSVAGFYTQFLLSTNQPDFGLAPTLDSMVLHLAYNGSYGDLNTEVTFRVFELKEMLYYDSVYYSNRHLDFETSEIASFTFTPKPNDSVFIDSVAYPPHLRLNISAQNPAFAEKILTASPVALEDNANFVEFIKGLYIIADPVDQGGSISYFNLTSSLSKISMHYANEEEDSLSYDFRLDGDCARFNRFWHNDYANADPLLREQVVAEDTSLGAQTLYMQAMQGINTQFRLPDFEDRFAQGSVALTRAELVLPVINASSDLPPPSRLLLGAYDAEGNLEQLVDYAEGVDYFGGAYDSTRMEYRFRITRHLQQILNGTRENQELVLLVNGRAVQASRVVIGGTAHPERRMRLELLYIPVNLN